MAVKIKFDSAHNAEQPTLVLATKSGKLLGKIPASNVKFKDGLNTYSELRFDVYKSDCVNSNANDRGKTLNNAQNKFWDQIKDFKLLWAKEWNKWFEIYVELKESSETVKSVEARSLGESELSQVNLYDIEINTEVDIERDDYRPTVLYNKDDPKISLLHRLMEKVPHYTVGHVDESLASIQRTFTFDNTTLYDAFQKIAEEINCLFVFNCYSSDEQRIIREIDIYDLQFYCLECGYRGEDKGVCPKCGSENIKSGYGVDTTIYISTDNLANDITYSTDEGSVKNCFKLEAGDELMTATLVNCNPNGSGYIWYITEEMKEDMSEALRNRLDEYDKLYNDFQKIHEVELPKNIINKYNELVDKYSKYTDAYNKMESNIVGYPALMKEYYNTIDFYLYLNNSFMPNANMSDTTAVNEARKLSSLTNSRVAVQNLSNCSEGTATSAVLAMAKATVDSRYQVKANESSFVDKPRWSGSFIVTNYSDEEDTATADIAVIIDEDYERFTKQKIEKLLSKSNDAVTDIVSLFDLGEDDFRREVQKYSLSRLTAFYDCCQSCIDILIDQGIANKETWANKNPDLYNKLYIPYYNKLLSLQDEIAIREEEISILIGTYDNSGDLISLGVQTVIENEKNNIQEALNFEKFLGEELFLEFASYRREDTYSNSNYISDGLNNGELFQNALEFIETAEKEIYKSATLQHSISASLKNLLTMKEFKPIVDYFEIGNWLRIRVDGKLYVLRLIGYEIDFERLENLQIEFSDVIRAENTILSDWESIYKQAQSMASSYGTVQRQAQQGEKSNSILSNWVANGLDATNTKIIGGADNQTQTWDDHGMLFKKYDSISDTYDDIQLKIINSTLAITDDNWRNVKAAVGLYHYFDPVTGKLTSAYGVNCETLVGRLILGEKLGIYNESGGLSFDDNGFIVTSNKNTNSFRVTPNDDKLVAISNGAQDILYVDENGRLHITGDGAGIDISSNPDIANKVSYDDLTTSGRTIINGDNITTGTLNANNVNIVGTLSADKINMSGKFEVYNGNFKGGYIGYMAGEVSGGIITDGIGVSNTSGNCYAIATDAGVRLQAGGHSIYLTSEGQAYINANRLTINGNVIINGSFTHNAEA